MICFIRLILLFSKTIVALLLFFCSFDPFDSFSLLFRLLLLNCDYNVVFSDGDCVVHGNDRHMFLFDRHIYFV